MALSDYRLCDVCDRKTFYDAMLNWDQYGNWEEGDAPVLEDGGAVAKGSLERLGAWAIICQDCVKTHAARVLTREQEQQLFGPGKR